MSSEIDDSWLGSMLRKAAMRGKNNSRKLLTSFPTIGMISYMAMPKTAIISKNTSPVPKARGIFILSRKLTNGLRPEEITMARNTATRISKEKYKPTARIAINIIRHKLPQLISTPKRESIPLEAGRDSLTFEKERRTTYIYYFLQFDYHCFLITP